MDVGKTTGWLQLIVRSTHVVFSVLLIGACWPTQAGGLGGAGSAMDGFQEGIREAQGRGQRQGEGFEDAFRTDISSAGNGLARCSYRTYAGFEFSINVRGGGFDCPASVQVNPETMQVRKQ